MAALTANVFPPRASNSVILCKQSLCGSIRFRELCITLLIEPILSNIYQLLCLTSGHYHVICIALPWLPSLPSARRTNFTTTSSTAPASRAVLASSTKPIWAAPKRSPPCSRSAPLRSPSPPPAASWVCPEPSGWPPSNPASSPCCSPSGDQPRSGPSPAHYLLLAAMHRICSPGPKTAVADWYQQTILSPLWGFEPERFSSQAFWDCFEQLLPEKASRGAKRRTRSAGGSASPPARPVEGKAARQPPLAGL